VSRSTVRTHCCRMTRSTVHGRGHGLARGRRCRSRGAVVGAVLDKSKGGAILGHLTVSIDRAVICAHVRAVVVCRTLAGRVVCTLVQAHVDTTSHSPLPHQLKQGTTVDCVVLDFKGHTRNYSG
jgi:hypothetical protein